MKLKFLNWYTQALGATLGIFACIYAYLNGYMFVYSNIGNNFDFLGFDGIISSYLLLPLCLLSLFLSLIKSYTIRKEIFNTSFESFNIFIVILTTIIGFMGAKIYFTIPAIFILFNIFKFCLHNKIIEKQESSVKDNEEEISQQTIQFNKIEKEVLDEADDSYKNNDTKALDTKREMAIELLIKNSDKQFITELTGLTLDEIDMLEKELGIIHT